MAGTSRGPTRQQLEAQRRRWEEQERKRQAREAAEQQRLADKQRKEDELNRQLALAADRTAAVERRVVEITSTLPAALLHDWDPLEFGQLKKPVEKVPLDLGADRTPLPSPQWEHYMPATPGVISRTSS